MHAETKEGSKKVEVDSVLWKRRETRSWKIELIERTFIMLKPDAISRKIIGKIFERIEKKGLKIVALKLVRMNEMKASELYSIHRGKDFFNDLIRSITSGPVMPMVLEGPNAVEIVRRIIGSTNPFEAEMGSIRGDYAIDITQNVIHAADSPESAEKEMRVFFEKEDVVSSS